MFAGEFDIVLVFAQRISHADTIFRIKKRGWTLIDPGCGEKRLHPVEIPLRNRIVFMIMATGAADSQTHKNLTGSRR
ncbi:MAG: hypothetical protein WKG07_41670 [Hymenobacter sp.]